MDLALLSATMRSTAFPPLDPWFAGETINYYYLGYSMGGALAHLAGASPAVAYNTYLATLLALLVVGVGSAAYDLAAMLGAGPRRALRAAAGSVLVGVVAGNLAITRAVVTEEFRGQTGFWPGIGWNASRVIERQPVDGVADKTINEFPAFSFVLGDLHPHVMALPFTVRGRRPGPPGHRGLVAARWREGLDAVGRHVARGTLGRRPLRAECVGPADLSGPRHRRGASGAPCRAGDSCLGPAARPRRIDRGGGGRRLAAVQPKRHPAQRGTGSGAHAHAGAALPAGVRPAGLARCGRAGRAAGRRLAVDARLARCELGRRGAGRCWSRAGKSWESSSSCWPLRRR